ncbi:MAG: hypothetical protein RL329_462, partial [Bacteroidota bacterium]
MRAIIKNLGPIKNNRQAIDLTKNFYIFVGENSSGKTYVSQLLWTIFNQNTIRKFASKAIFAIDFEHITNFEITKTLIDSILEQYAVFLKSELAITYNIESIPAHKTILDKFSIAFEYDFDKICPVEIIGIDFDEIRFTKPSLSLQVTIEKEKQPSKQLTDDKLSLRSLSGLRIRSRRTIKEVFLITILELLLDYKHHTFFLPASRTFYATFYQYIYEFERARQEKELEEMRLLIENMRKNKNEK